MVACVLFVFAFMLLVFTFRARSLWASRMLLLTANKKKQFEILYLKVHGKKSFVFL